MRLHNGYVHFYLLAMNCAQRSWSPSRAPSAGLRTTWLLAYEWRCLSRSPKLEPSRSKLAEIGAASLSQDSVGSCASFARRLNRNGAETPEASGCSLWVSYSLRFHPYVIDSAIPQLFSNSGSPIQVHITFKVRAPATQTWNTSAPLHNAV